MQENGPQMYDCQARYKSNFNKNVQRTPTPHQGQRIFVDSAPAQMTGSERFENRPWKELLSETLVPLKSPLGIVGYREVNENWIPNRVSVDRVTLALRNAIREDRTDWNRNIPSKVNDRNECKYDKNNDMPNDSIATMNMENMKIFHI